MFGDVAVPALADHLPRRIHDDRTDRDLVVLALRAFGEGERVAHPVFVG